MKIMALADLDGAPVPRRALRDVSMASGVAAIVFAGNVLPSEPVSACEAGRLYSSFFEALAALDVPVAVIPGAHDAYAHLFQQAIQDCGESPPVVVDRAVAPLGEALVGGLGGLVGDADDTGADMQAAGAPEGALRQAHLALAPLAEQKHDGPRLLLVHTPPYGTVVDQDNGHHVGQRIVNHLIAEVRATVTVCGLARDGQGKEAVDGALVVNPGPLVQGRYALIDLDVGAVRFGVLPRPGRRGPQPGPRSQGWLPVMDAA